MTKRSKTKCDLIIEFPEYVGSINVYSIKNDKQVSQAILNLEGCLKKSKNQGKTVIHQIGVYIIYIKSQEPTLYVGATKYYERRIGNHQTSLQSPLGHENKILQRCYNELKLKNQNLSHEKILEKYVSIYTHFYF